MALAAHAARVAAPPGARLRVWRWSSLCGGAMAGLVLAWARPTAAAPPAPTFEEPAAHVSHDGSLQLSWPGPLGDYEVQLVQLEPPPEPHQDPHPRVMYRGRMPSAHLSGLLEGDYSIRVRAHDDDGASPWSAAKLLQVRHHPLPLVYTMMVLGLLTFAGTAAVVLQSSRRPA